MNISETPLHIRTLGRFCMSANGKPVATVWPDDTIKGLFCSLLSPLDLYCSWDRLCRSVWGIPETRVNRRQLEEMFIRPLNSFLIKELGFNPLITGQEGIRINQQSVHIDAFEFYNTVLDGLRQLSFCSHVQAFEIFTRAKALYTGNFLPGMSGKIIESTRKDLDSLFRTAVMGSIPNTQGPSGSARTISSEPWLH